MIGEMLRLATAGPVACDKLTIELIVLCNKGWYFVCTVLPVVLLPLNPLLIAPLPLFLLQTAAGLSRSRSPYENAAKNFEQEYSTSLSGYQPSIVCRLFAFPLASLFDRTL